MPAETLGAFWKKRLNTLSEEGAHEQEGEEHNSIDAIDACRGLLAGYLGSNEGR